MQAGQVPIWVPLAVGMLGLIGVILGQLINSSRENRRWIRERDKELAKLAHDSMIDWRDRRLSIYSDLLKSIRLTLDIAIATGATKSEVVATTLIDQWKKRERQTRGVEQEVLLICSKAIRHLLGQNLSTMAAAEIPTFVKMPSKETYTDMGVLREMVREQLVDMQNYYGELIRLMRVDLGTDSYEVVQSDTGG